MEILALSAEAGPETMTAEPLEISVVIGVPFNAGAGGVDAMLWDKA